MEQNEFEIKRHPSGKGIVISKNDNDIRILKSLDGDIWFDTSKDESKIEISFFARDYNEWQTHLIFLSLMKRIFGRYIIQGDYKDTYSSLPKDFIDLDNKTITWHSDNGIDNVLKLIYHDKVITISLSKSKDNNYLNDVRIRTSGSKYERYHEEFTNFFQELWLFAPELTKDEKTFQKRK